MNPEFPPNNPRAELEARLTAYILGELPAHEAAILRQSLDDDSELAKLYEQLKTATKLIREVAATPAPETGESPAPLRLSEDRRQKLLAQFKTVAPKEFARSKPKPTATTRLLELAAAIAIIGTLAGLLLPSLAKSKAKAIRITVANNLKQIDLAKRMWADDKNKSAGDAPTASDLAPYLGWAEGKPRSIQGETYDFGKVGESPTAELAADDKSARALRSRRISLNDQVSYARAYGIGRGESPSAKSVAPAPPPTPASAEAATEKEDARAVNQRLLETVPLPPPAVASSPAQSHDVESFDRSGKPLQHLNIILPPTDDAAAWNSRSRAGKDNFDGSIQQASVNPHVNPSDASSTLLFPGSESDASTTVTATGGSGGSGTRGGGFFGRQNGVNPPIVNQTVLSFADGDADALRNQGIAQSSPASEFHVYNDQNRNPAIDSATGLPVAPLPTDLGADVSGAIDPTTGLPGNPPEVKLRMQFANASPEAVRAYDHERNAGNITNSGQILVYNGVVPNYDATSGSTAPNPSTIFPGAVASPAPTAAPVAADVRRRTSVDPQIAMEDDTLGIPEVSTKSGRQSALSLGDIPLIGRLSNSQTQSTGTNTYFAGTGAINNDRADYHFETGTLAANDYSDTETHGDKKQPMPSGNRTSGFSDRLKSAGLKPATSAAPTQTAAAAPYRGPTVMFQNFSSAPPKKDGYNLNAVDAKPSKPATPNKTEEQATGGSNVYQVNVVGYVSLSSTNAINPVVQPLTSTNSFTITTQQGAGNSPVGVTLSPTISGTNYIATDEAVRRQSGKASQFVATNGVIPQLEGHGSLGPVNVTHYNSLKIDAETEYVKQEKLLRKLQELAQDSSHTPAYIAKLQELKQLQETQVQLALKTAQASVETTMPSGPLIEVVEQADGKPAKNRSLGERIGGALTGNVTQTARIKIERDVTDVPGVAGQPSTSEMYDPYFIQTEFEGIQSEKILDQVVDRLKLREVWASKKGGGNPLTAAEARQLLKRSLQLSPEKSTSLVDIKVKSDKPEEAAKIANTIAEVYHDYRIKQRAELEEGRLQPLKAELEKQTKKVARVEDELAQIEQSEKPQADKPLPKPAAPLPVPQPEVTTTDNPFSTFSLNISDVSFKLAAASLEKGQMPDPSTIRSEEFINALDYRDPEPAAGAPLGFTWERARYPFAHNRDLLRFSVKTAAAGRTAGQPMNIVLLLDNSGSMERADRVQIIHEALRVLATQLQPQDKISVVTFAHIARLWVDGLPGSQAGEVADGLSKLTPEGGTNLEEAMRLAYETARRHYLANGINRVVLLTDGAANLGNVDPEALNQKVEAHRKEGIALDCFGIGWEGYNDDLLEVLSRHGDGRYGFINTPEEATTGFAKQLAGALHVAASDVKVQVEFNPKRVTAYRQIGYAKHQLTKEQFRDNTVDAAEIGAAESGNALYTIQVNPDGEGPIATVRVRYKVPGTQDYPEHEYAVPYTGAALPLEQAGTAIRLAGAASAFSEMLATSPFAAEVTTDQLLNLMRGVPEAYGIDERPKKLEWMIRQAKSLEGK